MNLKWLWIGLAILYAFTIYLVFKQDPTPHHVSLHIEGLTLKEKIALRCLDPDEIYDLLMQEEDLE